MQSVAWTLHGLDSGAPLLTLVTIIHDDDDAYVFDFFLSAMRISIMVLIFQWSATVQEPMSGRQWQLCMNPGAFTH